MTLHLPSHQAGLAPHAAPPRAFFGVVGVALLLAIVALLVPILLPVSTPTTTTPQEIALPGKAADDLVLPAQAATLSGKAADDLVIPR